MVGLPETGVTVPETASEMDWAANWEAARALSEKEVKILYSHSTTGEIIGGDVVLDCL